MRTHGLWFAGSLVGLIVGTASVAVGQTERDASGPPLVVAVEVDPGGKSDVGQVRETIGRELGRPIVPFVDGTAAVPTGTDEQDLLLVGLTRERIVMSMRRRLEPTVARSVPAPADAAARLRTIAWLAGNVARDQVSPFLRASAELGKVDAAAVSSEAAPPIPAPPPPAATEPAPIAPPPLPAVTPAETLAREAPAPQRTEAEWSVTVTGGPAGYATLEPALKPSLAFQVELVKHRPDRWLWGVAADLGPFGAVGAGLAVLGGSEWRWDKTRLEATAGLGMESKPYRDVQTTVNESSAVPSSETTVKVTEAYGPYVRGFVTLSRELTPSWDLLFRVGVNTSFGFENTGVMSALGLRLNLM